MQPAISLRGVTKSFGATVAVDGVDLDVAHGEFLTLLGPSGSGKTTVLRMIAGFESPSSGTVELGGADVTDVPAHRRDVNTVFQDYALFPHMTVAGNVEYGLKVKGVPAEERRRRTDEALEGVRLSGLGARRPAELSGGQRQRVALARALVNRPAVLLLDEPLGALDLKLREEMQVELKSIHASAGITFVYVTHDQGEALSMSDRIAVFNRGRIEQIGPPRDVYGRPATEFVAGFVGLSNILSGDAALRTVGRPGAFSVRPEHVDVSVSGPGFDATVTSIQYLGPESRIHCLLDGGSTVVASGQSGRLASFTLGQRVKVAWGPESVLELGPHH